MNLRGPNGTKTLIALGALLVLGAVDFAIAGKERIKRDGELVYLRLAPVDPRSLLQGDYLALRFELASQLSREHRPEGATGLADVVLDARRVASLATAGSAGQLKLRYRIRDGGVWLGTNAFFFQEGDWQRFFGASYGEFRVDRGSGEAVLVGLRNEKLAPL